MEKTTIIETAEILLAETGKEPSNRDVLRRIGRGSLADITPAMRDWRNERKEMAASAVEMPEAFEVVAASLVARLWREANIVTNERIAEVRAASESEVARIEAECDGLLDELNQAGEALAAASSEIEAIRSRADRVPELEKKLAIAEAKIESITSERDYSRTQLKEVQGVANEASRQLLTVEHERSVLEQKVADLTEENSGLVREIESQKAKNDELTKSISSLVAAAAGRGKSAE